MYMPVVLVDKQVIQKRSTLLHENIVRHCQAPVRPVVT